MFAESTSYEALRKALTEARHTAGLTQADVAARLSKQQSFVSKYELGERRLDVVEFINVCHALNADPISVLNSVLGKA